jgi:hypothetical protein
MRREVVRHEPGVDRSEWFGAVLRAALQNASRAVHELAAADRRFTGMGTTASPRSHERRGGRAGSSPDRGGGSPTGERAGFCAHSSAAW